MPRPGPPALGRGAAKAAWSASRLPLWRSPDPIVTFQREGFCTRAGSATISTGTRAWAVRPEIRSVTVTFRL